MYYNKCVDAVLEKFNHEDLSRGQARNIIQTYSECLNGTYINYARLTDIVNNKSSYDLLAKYVSKLNNITYLKAQKLIIGIKKKHKMRYTDLLLCVMNREIEEVLN
jgi:hypothetical protein